MKNYIITGKQGNKVQKKKQHQAIIHIHSLKFQFRKVCSVQKKKSGLLLFFFIIILNLVQPNTKHRH